MLKLRPMGAALLVRVLFWCWFAAAVAAGHQLVFLRLPPWMLPASTIFLAAILLGLGLGVPGLRRWLEAVESRTLVLLHVSRGVGVYFLHLHQQGDLPRAFAVPAGLGELVVAVMALPVVFAPLSEESRQRAIRIWSIVGFVNLLFVVFTLTRLQLTEPLALRAFGALPLVLYPTFLLPLLLAAHVVVLLRTTAHHDQR